MVIVLEPYFELEDHFLLALPNSQGVVFVDFAHCRRPENRPSNEVVSFKDISNFFQGCKIFVCGFLKRSSRGWSRRSNRRTRRWPITEFRVCCNLKNIFETGFNFKQSLLGVAEHRGSVRSSDPAAPVRILAYPKIYSWCCQDLTIALLSVEWTEA